MPTSADWVISANVQNLIQEYAILHLRLSEEKEQVEKYKVSIGHTLEK